MKREVSDEALEGDVLKLKVEYEGVRLRASRARSRATRWKAPGRAAATPGRLKAKRRP